MIRFCRRSLFLLEVAIALAFLGSMLPASQALAFSSTATPSTKTPSSSKPGIGKHSSLQSAPKSNGTHNNNDNDNDAKNQVNGKNSIVMLEKGQILRPSAPLSSSSSSNSDASTSDDAAVCSFDTHCVVSPVVLPPSDAYNKWQLYYYGNFGHWNDGSKGFLPSGWCGLAESDNGIDWVKIPGSLERGAILTPSSDPTAWDHAHIGVGDVIRISDKELHMYYFGGSSQVEEGLLGQPGAAFSGIRMRIGRAKSLDQGRTWEKLDMVLDYDESEGLFASWPRIILPTSNSDDNNDETPWQMIYHSFDGARWRVYGATSRDKGTTWKRKGLLLQGGESEDSFDYLGIGTRAITGPWRNGLLMIYEGVDKQWTHHLGAAYCPDINGNAPWEKLTDLKGCDEPGGPVASPGVEPMGSWTNTIIGTPYVVSMPDGSLRLYHCGKAGDDGHSIGLLISENGDVSPESWKPV